MAILNHLKSGQRTNNESIHAIGDTIRVPSFLRMLGIWFKRIGSPGCFRRLPNHRRDSLILDVALALRMGDQERAYSMLNRFTRVLASDPAYLNLLGVVFELRNDPAIARRCYGVAVCVDPAYAPARQNIRRLYELNTLGRTSLAVSLGDVELRRARTLPPALSPAGCILSDPLTSL
jgi:hypothetical protein